MLYGIEPPHSEPYQQPLCIYFAYLCFRWPSNSAFFQSVWLFDFTFHFWPVHCWGHRCGSDL